MILTESEKLEGLSGHRLDEAINAIKQDGYIVLENCLESEYIDQLKNELMDTFRKKQERLPIKPIDQYSLVDYPGVGGNHGFNRWNLRLPSKKPFLDNRLLGNPSANGIFRHFFDDSAIYNIIACDMNLQRSTFQNLHRDRSTFALIMNVPLVDMTIENGATQIFPGTHRMPGKGFTDSGALPYCPSWPPKSWQGKFLCVKTGSVIIRDVRMAHRGMVNNTEHPRPLININVCQLTHDTVPFHKLINILEKIGRLSRSQALARKDATLLRYWNGVGQILSHHAKTDRYEKRRIRKEDWNSLNADAQRLLRYAEIESYKTQSYLEERSVKHFSLIAELLYGAYRAKQEKKKVSSDRLLGLVEPSETRLVEAIQKNDHNDEDERIILSAMKARGLRI